MPVAASIVAGSGPLSLTAHWRELPSGIPIEIRTRAAGPGAGKRSDAGSVGSAIAAGILRVLQGVPPPVRRVFFVTNALDVAGTFLKGFD
jgi:hypothetical protein